MPHKTLKIIKRYQNRKLYDTSDSCYVTLEDIAEMIKQGDEVQIIDNETKEDLTGVTLAQIIFEEQKRKTHVLPLSTFRQIIQNSGDTIRDIVSKAVESGRGEIQHVREIVDEKIRPTVEHIRELPAVQSEIKHLRQRIDTLEGKVKTYERHRSQKS